MNKTTWTWLEYFTHKDQLLQTWQEIVLVDMVGVSVDWSVRASDALFFDKTYPAGTIFALYCDTGCTLSGWTRDKLAPLLPEYRFVDIVSGAGMYELEKSNYEYEKSQNSSTN